MNKTLTENDLISTSEINKQIKTKGYKKPYNEYSLSVDFLLKKGFAPAVKLNEGIYWKRQVLDQIFSELEKTAKPKVVENKNIEINNANYFNGLAVRVNSIEYMLKRIMSELNIK